jgi:cytoskeletal protein CcmA (bactofilin family)
MAVKKILNDSRTTIPETLIPIETIFTGDIETSSSVRVDGRVKGNVKAKGNVTLGPKGLIEGDVFGMSFDVAGTITGNIVAGGDVSILENSHVLGDISATALHIEQGASYNGKCIVGSVESAKLKPAPPVAETPPKK